MNSTAFLEIDPHDQAPSVARCRDALDRITNSAMFQAAPRLVSFLRFVVEETLAGRAASIKAYTIAVEALGRPDDFDPVADPIVRVEAVRLRSALVRYYAGPGAADPVRITLPLGRYVAHFLPKSDSVASKRAGHPGQGQAEERPPTLVGNGWALPDSHRDALRTVFRQETRFLLSAIQTLERQLKALQSDVAQQRAM